MDPVAMLDWGERRPPPPPPPPLPLPPPADVPVDDAADHLSFEDSDRFEEDSLCSWISEPESLCNNWRGWKKPSLTSTSGLSGGAVCGSSSVSANLSCAAAAALAANRRTADEGQVLPLVELSARCVASHIAFELVESVFPPVPEQLQLRIAYWSFPENEDDIRLYSCLANGSAEEYQKGEQLLRNGAVKEPLQIGFHLSACVNLAQTSPLVSSGKSNFFNVAVTFDRRRITSCNCTCTSSAYWCSHVVAVCLHRIQWPNQVCLRAPVSESLSRLHRDQLQKFAQYLISELPQQILPTAQRLLDELLSAQPSAINSVCGAPDPTAGASANEQTSWYLDEGALHENIHKILIKFCVPAPIVFSDVNYLSTSAPPSAAEWSSLLRPLRGREPEGMWNLLSIVREMYKRNDRNAVPLLEIITEECIMCEQIMLWWFNTKVALHNGSSGHGGRHSGGGNGGGNGGGINGNSNASQHAGSSLCDELVILWRLAALNPGLAPEERVTLRSQFKDWHLKIIEKVSKIRGLNGQAAVRSIASIISSMTNPVNNGVPSGNATRTDFDIFPGFMPAVEASYLDWEDYPLPGITYSHGNRLYHCPFTCFRHINPNIGIADVNLQDVPEASGTSEPPPSKAAEEPPSNSVADGNRSSISSEGFCENDIMLMVAGEESDGNDLQCSDISVPSGEDSDCSQNETKRLEHTDGEPEKEIVAEVVKPAQKALEEVDLDSDSSGAASPPSAAATVNVSESKSDSFSSEQSGDEYQALEALQNFPTVPTGSRQRKKREATPDEANAMFSALSKLEDPWDVLFARAEGLHAHGHSKEACVLGVQLAQELLTRPPDLMPDVLPPPPKGKRKKVHPASHQLSCLASATLAKCAFLCTVLAENSSHHHLAFRVGLFALEMARPPASTKPLEVKLANQESDIVHFLKRIPLGVQELNIIRKKAEQLKDGTLKSRGEALLPLMLASYIFDALIVPTTNRESRVLVQPGVQRTPADEVLGFEASVAALGLKANVSEADHPLLCEGTRRQRGELAISMLVHYKDNAEKLTRIMEKLLDREVHQQYRAPILSLYYTTNPPAAWWSYHNQHGRGARRDKDDEVVSLQAQRAAAAAAASGAATVAQVDGVSGLAEGVGSRPQSTTSAELEQSLASLSLVSTNAPSGVSQQSHMTNTQNTAQMITGRSGKESSRFKGKRPYPSVPNQPSEASAHFMFELAKTVLNKAGGSSTTSLFTQVTAGQNHRRAHHALHMCAFQIGLYALGLHNCVSPNWLSRTYSSHVSWITGQASELGAAAIAFLVDTWEGHLTPTEAVGIADSASRVCDLTTVQLAAELALSCLPHAHALNPHEIQRAILQCKEQSDTLLEQSCLTVENAAKGGGVYPEVLFDVARHWYDLYLKHSPGGTDNYEPSDCHHQVQHEFLAQLEGMEAAGLPAHMRSSNASSMNAVGCVEVAIPRLITPQPPPPPPPVMAPPQSQALQLPPTVTHNPHPVTVHFPPVVSSALPLGVGVGVPYATTIPYNFIQGLTTGFAAPAAAPPANSVAGPVHHHHMQHHHHPHPHLSHHPIAQMHHPMPHPAAAAAAAALGTQIPLQMYLSPPPTVFQYPSGASAAAPPAAPPQYQPLQPLVTSAGLGVGQYYPTVSFTAPTSGNAATVVVAGTGVRTVAGPAQLYPAVVTAAAPPPPPPPPPPPAPTVEPPVSVASSGQAQANPSQTQYTPKQLKYLMASYRVGMLAMETLARRVHDDRPQAKYARSPPYGVDVKWFMGVAKKLGTQCLHQLCICAVNSIASPFVLHEIAMEAAQFLAHNNPTLALRSTLLPLVQKCQQMYIQCMHQKLYHIQPADYEDFVSIVCSARTAFQHTPDGMGQFKEWLQSIRRSKSCKKDLWAQIMASLQLK